jgi:DNA-binding CsgD family transcriptional regulator
VLPAAVPPHYLDRLARAFQPGGHRPTPRTTRDAAGVAGLIQPLSDRELQVLRPLAAGRSNQQIAEALVVALGTVKKHVGHILDKLGRPTAPRPSPAPARWSCCDKQPAARASGQSRCPAGASRGRENVVGLPADAGIVSGS